jgi:aspartate kinase
VIVVKFGGTSVGDAAAIARVAEIVATRIKRRPIVVVSAMGGVTNQLLALAEQAAHGHLIGALRGVEGIRERHLTTAESLLGGTESEGEVCAELSATIDELASLAEALSTLGHITPRSLDTIAAMGEQLSAPLVVAAMARHGLPVELVDARQVMITDNDFTHARPNTEAIAERARMTLSPLVKQRRIPVLGGFIGATSQGITTTLGRGGSDYSASLLGAALRAEAIEIWTDVDGMLTADPRVISGARLIGRIRFDEASELAAFGAKVLHPSTIAPAVHLGIPVYIFNSRNPQGGGTEITFDAPTCAVRAIAGKTGIAVIKVRSPAMLLLHGFMRTIFEAFANHKVSVDVVATSEVSLSATVEESAGLEGLLMELSRLGDVSIERNRGIVAIVGSGLSNDGAAMAAALRAIGNVKVHMLSLSSTGINLTVIVDAAEVSGVMRRLHDAFFGEAAS